MILIYTIVAKLTLGRKDKIFSYAQGNVDGFYWLDKDLLDFAGWYGGAAGALLAPGQGAGVGLHELKSDPNTGDWQPAGALLTILGAAARKQGIRFIMMLSYKEQNS